MTNYAEWLYKFDKGNHTPKAPEQKWSREKTWQAVIQDFKNSRIAKLGEENSMDKADQIWDTIREQARAAYPDAESEAQAISQFLATPEGSELYNVYQNSMDSSRSGSQGSDPDPKKDLELSESSELFQKQREALRKAHPTMSDAEAMDAFLRTPEGARFYSDYINSRG